LLPVHPDANEIRCVVRLLRNLSEQSTPLQAASPFLLVQELRFLWNT
jgi:hypothetical protein